MPRLPSSRSNRRPQLAQTLENAEFSAPDSQPMSDVLRLVENVRQLQEENVALLEQVEELQGGLKARDDLLASAKEALEQQKADFHNTELSLKESSARERQQRTEVQGKLEQSKSAIDGLFKKIARLDNGLQAVEVQCQTAQAKCQSQEADFANTESRLKESIAKQKRKTAKVQVQLGRSKATVKELGGQLRNARESCQSHEADMGKLRREILGRENEKKLLQQGRQSVVKENNAIKRDLKATRAALANSQDQGRDQADAKAGQIEAVLGIAQFSLKKAKGECKSQEDELRKMAQSRGS
ncbi:hypothetical protein CDV36_006624 [Fusarium kuroshium]|uniref:Uncharacterized protein n=1 Tax=Fusarium kuroshium TaxID=2010991 RepID=A0A3M2S972_9HYPO|nr:hypothetical protein CDV36_006624 [Fusarium kuroshium]